MEIFAVFFSDPQKTHKYTLWVESRIVERKSGGTYINLCALKI